MCIRVRNGNGMRGKRRAGIEFNVWELRVVNWTSGQILYSAPPLCRKTYIMSFVKMMNKAFYIVCH